MLGRPETGQKGADVKARKGDTLIVSGHRVGQARRMGTIVEVLGADGSPPFRVRWQGSDEDHLVVPGSDASVEPGCP